ncbi:hypothetical protein F4604DRAFT_1918597 [Suillus subluteus]|nr:hypothetical protein F4604DRAFT_1918597 [Suillus subluteus]
MSTDAQPVVVSFPLKIVASELCLPATKEGYDPDTLAFFDAYSQFDQSLATNDSANTMAAASVLFERAERMRLDNGISSLDLVSRQLGEHLHDMGTQSDKLDAYAKVSITEETYLGNRLAHSISRQRQIHRFRIPACEFQQTILAVLVLYHQHDFAAPFEPQTDVNPKKNEDEGDALERPEITREVV